MPMNSERKPGPLVTGVRKVTIDRDAAGQRIDNFLRRELPGVPKSRVYRLLRRGEVRVNGARVRADYRLTAGDEVRVPPARIEPRGAPPPAAAAQDIASRVLFEDRRLLVLDKPAGLAVHGGSGLSFGVIELMRAARPEGEALALVHRLDRDTSGCLVLTKRRSALRELQALFRAGLVEKNYLALAAGDWQFGDRLLDASLSVTHRRRGERHVVVAGDGKPAATRVRPLRRIGRCSLLQCQPQSGRTHQIRVHLAAAGHPIVGDERYGDPRVNRAAQQAGLSRLFLHAQAIAFTDGRGNERHFTAPLPEELERHLRQLEQRRDGPKNARRSR